MFLIQTETNGACTAKQIVFDKDAKLPIVIMKNASRELRKDVWVMEGNAEHDDEKTVNTLCKSSTDDFLQCEVLNYTEYDGSAESIKRLK